MKKKEELKVITENPFRRTMTDPQGRKRWRSSQNLAKPTQTVADRKWSRRRLAETASVHDDDQRFWEKRYPGWRMVSCQSTYNEISGWNIYLELRRME